MEAGINAGIGPSPDISLELTCAVFRVIGYDHRDLGEYETSFSAAAFLGVCWTIRTDGSPCRPARTKSPRLTRTSNMYTGLGYISEWGSVQLRKVLRVFTILYVGS